ncbi:MAG: hypothetical protein KF753_24005 [Caldilineaceae bacterium]|nr:hypothetical protein [Caldilineaceae bacterium]
MKEAQILQDFNALPAEAQELVSALVALLNREHQRSKSSHKKNAIHLTDEKFIGLWKDRNDMQDSGTYIRNLRKSEWG